MTTIAHYDFSRNVTSKDGEGIVSITDDFGGNTTLLGNAHQPEWSDSFRGYWGCRTTPTDLNGLMADCPEFELNDFDLIFSIQRNRAGEYDGVLGFQTDVTTASMSGLFVRFNNSNRLQVYVATGNGAWAIVNTSSTRFGVGWRGIIRVIKIGTSCTIQINGRNEALTLTGESVPSTMVYNSGVTSIGCYLSSSVGIGPAGTGDVVIGELWVGASMTTMESTGIVESMMRKWGGSDRVDLLINDQYKQSGTAIRTANKWAKKPGSAPTITADAWDNQRHSPVVIARPGKWHMWYIGINSDGSLINVCYVYSTDSGSTWTKPILSRVSFSGSSANNIWVEVPIGSSQDFDVKWDSQNNRFVFHVRESHVGDGQDERCYLGESIDPLVDVAIKKLVTSKTIWNTTGTGPGSMLIETKGIIHLPSGRWAIPYTFDHLADSRSIGMYKSITSDPFGEWYDAGTYLLASDANNQYYSFLPSQIEDGQNIVGTVPEFGDDDDYLGPLWSGYITDGSTLESDKDSVLDLGGVGEFDEKFITKASFFDVGDGTMRMYYTGGNVVHGAFPRNMFMSVATMESRRYVSITNGTWTTDLLSWKPTSTITVNASATEYAQITYRLINTLSAELTGQTIAKCTPLSRDSQEHVLKWDDTTVYPEGEYAIEFTIPSGAELHSYEFHRVPVIDDVQDTWPTSSDIATAVRAELNANPVITKQIPQIEYSR